MQEFLDQVGVDWHLLLSQAVNFFLLLIILRVLLYRPILKFLGERRKKIEEGLAKAEAAGTRLHEIELIGKGKLKEAEQEGIAIIEKAETEAGKVESGIIAKAKEKEADIMKDAHATAKNQLEENKKRMYEESVALVKAALIKTVELAPENINEELIKKAIREVTITQ
ncbi:MAG: hypothetical protein Q7S36_01340 [Candidatus Liptonbacteria bacterium]|nr:hypothetical protein [Candidatus Liptonbacteria bacterium]